MYRNTWHKEEKANTFVDILKTMSYASAAKGDGSGKKLGKRTTSSLGSKLMYFRAEAEKLITKEEETRKKKKAVAKPGWR